MTSRFAVAVSVAVLASCAAPPSHPITVGEARARMVGMTTAQVTACMGQPTLPQTRGNVTVPAGADKQALETMAAEAVKKYIESRPVRRVIIVPGKLVNIVV